MKRWLFLLMTITLSISLNKVLAVEQLNIYDEPEFVNEGTVTINFLSKIKEDADEDIDNPVVEGVQIEIYYRTNGQMINIKELSQFMDKELNLISNENGQIILNDFPYGFYEYYVVSVPLGYKESTQVRKIDLNILNSNINKYDFIIEDLQFAGGSTIVEEDKEELPNIEEDKEVENVENNNQTATNEIQENVEYNQYIPYTDEFVSLNSNNMNINTILTKSYNREKSSDDNNILDNRLTYNIKLTGRKMKLDIISAMKNIKMNDNIKIAILDNHSDFHKAYIVADMPPVNKYKRNKKILTVEKVIVRNSTINVDNVHLGVQRQIMS